MSFVHLEVHSNYSLLAGASGVEELVDRAAFLGMPALALTDTNGMYAVVPFVKACREAGLKPIVGVELVCPRGGDPASPPARAVVIPADLEGYKETCRLVTARHLQHDFSLEKALRASPENVFVASDNADLLRALRGRRNVYVALPPGEGVGAKQRRYHLASLAENLNLGTIATNRVHFAAPEGYELHRVLSAVRTRSTTGTLPRGATVDRSCWLKGAEEMEKLFRDFPAALRNASEVAWRVNVDLDFDVPRPPRFDPPPGESCFSYLASLAFDGLRRRLGAFGREALDLLTRELDVIERLGMASYFLVCRDIVRFARERGIPSLGRGSAANSMVSYCLGITHVNPMKHNLFFERFLNLERATPPDFDLDFGTEDREAILRYIFSKYGRDHTAMVSTVSTLRARSAIRETARAFGIPGGEIDAVVKRIPHFASTEALEEELAARPDTRGLPLREEPFRTILATAKRIAGFPRHIATHPCGLVIAPEPITDLMPLEMGERGLAITQWSMYPVEDAGLIKIDVIGQKGLAVIRDTVRAVERNYGISVAEEDIDYLADEKAKALMREGKTEGAFYIESPIMQQLLKQARCDDFEVLTALSSIIRPGVSNYGGKREYLRRYLGEEPVIYPHPSLEGVLGDTYGCLIYQEQVIRTAVAMAGMTLAEADGLRLCMSKKRNWERMENYRERFFAGARDKGIPERVIEEVFSRIESFAGYAFCKAHSASFALESFQSLYWRSHYPAEFMAAVLSNRGGYYSTMEYIEEARRMGLTILPPCVNRSAVAYEGRGREIRTGLMQVKGLRSGMMERIVSERRGGEYRSVDDLLARVPLTRKEAETLAGCGAMDSLGGSRPEILWQVALMCGAGEECGARATARKPLPAGGRIVRREAGAAARAGAGETVRELVKKLPPLEDITLEEKLTAELECLGVTISAHPFALFRRRVESARRLRPIIPAVDLGDYAGRTVYTLGWKVAAKRLRAAGTGRMMGFVSFSDESGRLETTFFPDAYERCAEELLRGPGPFLIMGRVDVDMGVPNLVVEKIGLLA